MGKEDKEAEAEVDVSVLCAVVGEPSRSVNPERSLSALCDGKLTPIPRPMTLPALLSLIGDPAEEVVPPRSDGSPLDCLAIEIL